MFKLPLYPDSSAADPIPASGHRRASADAKDVCECEEGQRKPPLFNSVALCAIPP